MLLQEAQSNFFEGKYEKTISICKNVIENNPQMSQSYIGIGGKEDFIGYEQQFIKEFYRTYSKKIPKKSPYDLLSLTLLLSSDFQEDKSWYESQLKLHPLNYQLQFGLGLLHGNFDNQKSEKLFIIIFIEIRSNFDKAQQCIAFEHYSKGRFAQARQHALNSLATNPQNQYSLFIKAMTNPNQEEIVDELRQLVDKCTHYLVPLYELGQIYFNKNQFKDAIQCFQKCSEKSSAYDSAKAGIGRCIIQLKQYEKAIQLLEDLLSKEESQEIVMALALAYCRTSRINESRQMIAKCKQCNPENIKIDFILADTYMQEGKYDQAIATYKEILKAQPEMYEAEKMIALAFLKKRDIYNAQQWCQQYKFHQPEDNIIDIKFAEEYYLMKMYDEALGLFSQCLNRDFSAVEIYPKVITIYSERHMYEQSLFWAKKWSEVEPENPEFWDTISDITKTIGIKIRNKEWEPKKKRHIF